MRFMVMAADRAPTIATMIHAIWRQAGKPPAARAASNAPTSANGRAKTECSNFIISRTVRIRPLFMFKKQNRGARFGLAPVPAGLLPSRNRHIHIWRSDISTDRDGIARRLFHCPIFASLVWMIAQVIAKNHAPLECRAALGAHIQMMFRKLSGPAKGFSASEAEIALVTIA